MRSVRWVAALFVLIPGCNKEQPAAPKPQQPSVKPAKELGFEHSLAGKPVEAEEKVDCPTEAEIVKAEVTKTFREEADALKKELYAGKYAEAHTRLVGAIKAGGRSYGGWYRPASIVDYFLADVRSEYKQQYQALNSWMVACPDSAAILALRSKWFKDAAWLFRGGAFASKTDPKQLKKYEEYIGYAMREASTALKIDPTHPIALLAALELSEVGALSKEQFEQVYAKLLEIDPDMIQAHKVVLQVLSPQWGGSREKVLSFARSLVKESKKGSALPTLLVEAHDWVRRSTKDKLEYYKEPGVWEEMQAASDRLIEDFPDNGYYPYLIAKHAHLAGHEELARKYHDIAMAREPNLGVIRKQAEILKGADDD